jgi:hypothetical protein
LRKQFNLYFFSYHIYPSTIADILKEQEEMEARLQAEKK